MSDVIEILVECEPCGGTGRWRDGTRRPTCGWCRGAGKVPHVLNCEHDGSLSGYGDLDDPQWDGASECDTCLAVFAAWPREEPWPPVPARPNTCKCAHGREVHRAFSDECVVHECGCARYVEVLS